MSVWILWYFEGVSSISTTLLAVNSTLDTMKTKANTLSSNLTDLKTDIDTICTGPCSIDTTGVALSIDTNNVSPIMYM